MWYKLKIAHVEKCPGKAVAFLAMGRVWIFMCTR